MEVVWADSAQVLNALLLYPAVTTRLLLGRQSIKKNPPFPGGFASPAGNSGKSQAGIGNLDPQHAAESPGAVVRIRTVVVREDMVIAAVAKESTAEFSNFNRCFHPARGLQVVISQFLELPVLFFS